MGRCDQMIDEAEQGQNGDEDANVAPVNLPDAIGDATRAP